MILSNNMHHEEIHNVNKVTCVRSNDVRLKLNIMNKNLQWNVCPIHAELVLPPMDK